MGMIGTGESFVTPKKQASICAKLQRNFQVPGPYRDSTLESLKDTEGANC
jgi:hypothetical protein